MADASNSSATAWHCLCSTLVLVTQYELDQLPTRASPGQDNAIILPFASNEFGEADSISKSTLHNLLQDRKPIIMRREDGFEKRAPLRCTRCKLIVAYKVLDASGTASTDRVFLLPGGLTRTEDMKLGKIPQPPAWGTENV
jgi:hypothetical protein